MNWAIVKPVRKRQICTTMRYQQPFLVLSFVAMSNWACGGEETDVSVASTQTTVVNLLTVPQVDDGVAPGFDLDQFESDQSDGRSCYQRDLVDPAGLRGIDNQLATLAPLLNLEGEGALEGLIQQAINDGRLLILFQLEQKTDGTYRLMMRRGKDQPLLGTNGTILSDQTLALEQSEPMAIADNLVINSQQVEIGPVDLNIPVVVFDGVYTMHLPQGRIRFTLDEQGRLIKGMMGGGVTSASLNAMMEQAAVRLPDFVVLLRSGVEQAKDLAVTSSGECEQLSMAVTFEAIPAFTYE